MGRPRYEPGGVDARGKITAAFWDLIAERPYAEISVLDIVRRAGVNKNTFYYHFTNIDEMAAAAVGESRDTQAFAQLLASIDAFGADAVGPEDARLHQSFERLGLIAGSHSSPALRELLKDTIAQGWCEMFDIDLQAASFADEVSFEFALGGALAIIGMRPTDDDGFTFRKAMSFALRDEVIQRLKAIARRTQTSDIRLI